MIPPSRCSTLRSLARTHARTLQGRRVRRRKRNRILHLIFRGVSEKKKGKEKEISRFPRPWAGGYYLTLVTPSSVHDFDPIRLDDLGKKKKKGEKNAHSAPYMREGEERPQKKRKGRRVQGIEGGREDASPSSDDLSSWLRPAASQPVIHPADRFRFWEEESPGWREEARGRL
ncbi:hypothetical protein IWZ01DRAFT_368353 [Phyllosticta capitalensis]